MYQLEIMIEEDIKKLKNKELIKELRPYADEWDDKLYVELLFNCNIIDGELSSVVNCFVSGHRGKHVCLKRDITDQLEKIFYNELYERVAMEG